MENPDFETGTLTGWETSADWLTVTTATNDTFNRNKAAQIRGRFSTTGWITNSLYQTVAIESTDALELSGFLKCRTLESLGPGATGVVRVTLTDGESASTMEWAATNSWERFELFRSSVGVADGGFESGSLTNWTVYTEDLTAWAGVSAPHYGSYSLCITGKWSGWSWNEVCQYMTLQSGDVVHASAWFKANWFQKYGDGTFAVAGIKLEKDDADFEDVVTACYMGGEWILLSFDAVITNSGQYTYRAMICGDYPLVEVDVVFDDISLSREGSLGSATSVTVRLDYIGNSGGEGYTNAVDIYMDSVWLAGATPGQVPATNIYLTLCDQAAATAADPSETDIPMLEYPGLNTFGFPNNITNVLNFPASVAAAVSGWRFRYLTNNVVLTMTNTIELYGYVTNEFHQSPPGVLEFDQYMYCRRFWNSARGTPVEIDTNAPYFTLGDKDGSSAEFGAGPFPEQHTYVVGTPLTNFPQRMATPYSGQWPRILHVVFPENLGQFDRNWDKHFVLSAVATNHLDATGDWDIKAGKMYLRCTDEGHTNLNFNTQEIHLGWASEEEAYGLVDYPNCTYQDHNEVFLRAGWWNGMIDSAGWFVTQVPRGSATIEPIELYSRKSGDWAPKVYEEYLFAWPNTISGVRSLFDEDSADRVPGPASYHVGYKIGHQFGTNEFGEPKYPGVIELRGNGYFRMTDFDGVMGGSFRPLAGDIFGTYMHREDAPIIPSAHMQLVPRTTLTNEPDDSYVEAFMPIRSKTNYWFTGALKVDMHATPDQVEDTGAWFDLEADIYANRALVRTEHGKMNLFAQVDMYWRGGDAINDYAEGHDFDLVMVKKADGEWVSHRPVNPPTNIYHRTLCAFRSNDVLYIMQQDRAPNTYGFSTEAPYRKVSTFEISLLDDGGRDLDIEMFEQNTDSETDDNCVIACGLNEDLAKGELVHSRYRYRGIYAPGITLIQPNETCGGESWSNNSYTIEFVATDGDDKPLEARLFYGNGLDGDWKLINTNAVLYVPTNTHRMTYVWDVSGVTAGAYYVKAEAERVEGGKVGFDVSDSRLQVGSTYGFPQNGSTNLVVTTNTVGYLGSNMSFEVGISNGWYGGADHLQIEASSLQVWDGLYAARFYGSGWSGWSWNRLAQEVPCVAGETLHVQGRVFIGRLLEDVGGDVYAGVKLESTNGGGYSEARFNAPATTGMWLNVDFTRLIPASGTEQLLLFVAGMECTGAEVFFDDFSVTSTNTGAIVTNLVRAGYWEGSSPVDVTAHDALVFWAAGTRGWSTLDVWAADADGVTNAVRLTNYIERLVSAAQRVDVPWSAFGGIDKTRLASLGFRTPVTNHDVTVTRVQSAEVPFGIRAEFLAPPVVEPSGLAHYNPGETVVERVTIQNHRGTAVSNVKIQVVQEYTEDTLWLDAAPPFPRVSERTRRGDRLCGGFEGLFTNQTIPASGSLVLTNTYTLPYGHFIYHTNFAIPAGEDFWMYRNLAARAQVHVVVREADGDNVFDRDQCGIYSMDDNFDFDEDRLPDAYEMDYSGTITGLYADADSDEDTFSDMDEFIAGSDPIDEFSVPDAGAVQAEAEGTAELWVNTVTGRVYWAEWSESLTPAVWHQVGTGLLEGDGSVMSIPDPYAADATNRYYRVGVKLGPGQWPY